ncbi:MAG: hypothetical protein JRC87_00895 [Deltaproteobacteria bacterium]|nr:hypothetical protein [Deltaproteobacteria bacterium]MBW2658146.1 hypothetical protein [Deltaproteobacteria bacterium]
MDCATFSSWLENRDSYDLSEADRAMKHAIVCAECKDLLHNDEELERFVTRMFQYEMMDERLVGKIDRSLDSAGLKRGFRGGIAAAFAVVAVAVLFFVFIPGRGNFSSMDEFGQYVVQEHREHGKITPLFEKIGDIGQWGQDNLHHSLDVNTLPAGNIKIVGGRICTIKNCEFAHLLYQDGKQFYSLFAVSGDEIGFDLEPGRIYSLTVSNVKLHVWIKQKMVYALTG